MCPPSLNKARLHGLLGMAMRAGKCVSGADGVTAALKKGKVFLVVLAEELTENSMQKLLPHVRRSQAQMARLPQQMMGECTGKWNNRVLAITDRQFARGIYEALEGWNNESGVEECQK